MFKNYLKIALRNVKKHKGYSFINIAGLAIGIACCILILLWVRDELSFDNFHEKAELPEVVDSMRYTQAPRFLIRYENRKFYEQMAAKLCLSCRNQRDYFRGYGFSSTLNRSFDGKLPGF